MGPVGAGPRTGRAAGLCAGFDAPGFANRSSGFGLGRGGRGRGAGGFGRGGGWGGGAGRGNRWRWWYHATGLPGWARGAGAWDPDAGVDPTEEKNLIQRQIGFLEEQLGSARRRLAKITNDSQEE